jgi:predicted Zn-dependent protease
VTKAEPVAAKFASANAKSLNRDRYLDHIRGLQFGDNPKDGIVRGNAFLHPLLRIGVTFPEGWELTNTPSAVMAQEPGTQHFMVLQEVERQAGLPARASVADIAVAAMRKAGFKVMNGTMLNINGNEAHVGIYSGKMKDVGDVVMRAAHVQVGRQVYVIAGFTPKDEFDYVDPDIQAAVRSFRQLSQQEAQNIRPNRVDFYTVQKNDSWQSIAARQGKGFVNAATLAIMNDHEVSVQPQPGSVIKIVVEG